MAVIDKITQIKSNLLTEISEIQDELKLVEEMESELAAELLAAEEKGFEAGLAQSGQANGSDKLYSDAELNAELQPLRDQIQALTDSAALAAEALPGQLQAASEQAVASFKAELKAAYEAQQVAESQGETGFGNLLA